MLGKAMLATMFDYDAAMNMRMLDRAATLGDEQLDAPEEYSRGSMRDTLWHTLIVAYGWRNQCEDVDVRRLPPPVEPTATVAALRAFQQEEAGRVRGFLDGMSEDDLTTSVPLKMRDGQERTLTRWQILLHILYHSAQHRGEVAELLTRHGQSPGDTDFLFYVLAPPAA